MKMDRFNRREFMVKTVASGTAAAVMASLAQAAEKPAAKPGRKPRANTGVMQEYSKLKISTPNAEKLGWRLCVQQYTFRDRSFYEMLEVMVKLGVQNVEPAYFLPLSKEKPDLKTSESLTADQRKEMKKRMDDLGIKMPKY